MLRVFFFADTEDGEDEKDEEDEEDEGFEEEIIINDFDESCNFERDNEKHRHADFFKRNDEILKSNATKADNISKGKAADSNAILKKNPQTPNQLVQNESGCFELIQTSRYKNRNYFIKIRSTIKF